MARFLSVVAIQQVCSQDVFLPKHVSHPWPDAGPGAAAGAVFGAAAGAVVGFWVGPIVHHDPPCSPHLDPNPPIPNSTNVLMPDCRLAAPGWPTFNTADELQSDSTWAQYFNTVYGEIPSIGYPICVGSFTQIAVRGGYEISANADDCVDSTVEDGTLIHALTSWIEPPKDLVRHIYNSRNVNHAVPANTWAEIQHLHSEADEGESWMFLEFGSAVWFNVGNTAVFEDHPDASEYFLSRHCGESHWAWGTKHTECEFDFRHWYKEARKQQYTSLQFTHHYDCGCGEEGPSSWTHKKLCTTEIIDINARCIDNGCASVYRAGWAARQDCDCDSSKQYSNCKGFGL